MSHFRFAASVVVLALGLVALALFLAAVLPYAAWSYLLTAIGCTGFYFAGKKKWWAWGINLSSQVLWLTYAIATGQFGFIVGSFTYGFFYALNLWRWWRQARPKPQPTCKANLQSQPAKLTCTADVCEDCDSFPQCPNPRYGYKPRRTSPLDCDKCVVQEPDECRACARWTRPAHQR